MEVTIVTYQDKNVLEITESDGRVFFTATFNGKLNVFDIIDTYSVVMTVANDYSEKEAKSIWARTLQIKKGD